MDLFFKCMLSWRKESGYPIIKENPLCVGLELMLIQSEFQILEQNKKYYPLSWFNPNTTQVTAFVETWTAKIWTL